MSDDQIPEWIEKADRSLSGYARILAEFGCVDGRSIEVMIDSIFRAYDIRTREADVLRELLRFSEKQRVDAQRECEELRRKLESFCDSEFNHNFEPKGEVMQHCTICGKEFNPMEE